VEVIHADNSACVALADASMDWQHPNATCLMGRDLSAFDFLGATKKWFCACFFKSGWWQPAPKYNVFKWILTLSGYKSDL
jgi:hypothetical protein